MLKKIIPDKLKRKLRKYKILFLIGKSRFIHQKRIKEIKKKNKIKIAFLLVNESIWKYEQIYFLFKENDRYEPVVFICPFLTYGSEIMEQEMNHSFETFKKRGYEVRKTLQEDGCYLDIKNDFHPDLIFFCTPWGHTLSQYQIHNFLDTLTCYVPYGFKSSYLYEAHFNKDLQNLSWKFFVETPIHEKLAKKYSLAKGKNTVVTGFPGMDFLLDKEYKAKDVWKRQEQEKKRIIWAPHHTIQGYQKALDYSTFLTYAEFMFEIAEKYKEQIQISFKPHPNLKGKLDAVWGGKKTNEYYERWKNLPNGQLNEGAYIDLFIASDAMIHDSGSFVIEYLYVSKPVLYLIGSEKVKEQYNEIGKEALKVMYLGYNRKDITYFIESILLNNNDDMREERTTFFNELVKPPNNLTASENIFNYINEVVTS